MPNSLPTPQIRYADQVTAGEGQCDCACATAVLTTSDQTNQDCACADPTAVTLDLNQPYILNPTHQTILHTDHHETIITDTTTPVLLNRSASVLLRHFQQPYTPAAPPTEWIENWGEAHIQNILQEMARTRLLVPLNHTQTLAETNTTLTAWLHITDRCNLRCAYCYLPHKHVDMSWETGQSALKATFRAAQKHSYRQVKLKYAGGEPLIRFSFICDLHQYAQQLADVHGIALDGVVLSNGALLTPEIITRIKQHNLRLMISLDGLHDAHDRQRFYADGRGSFQDVQQNINTALEMDLIPDISITVSARNVADLPELIAWILEKDLPFSLNFYRENDYTASQKDLQLEEQAVIDGMLAAFRTIEDNLPRRSLLASLVDRANLAVPHLRTCSVGHSYLVFNEQGHVSKCQMHMSQTITTSDDADLLATIRLDSVGIQNLPVAEKEGCRTCEWKYWCAGGCPLITYRATGRYDVKSPNCAIYKALYPEAVRLETLRLLKYEQELA